MTALRGHDTLYREACFACTTPYQVMGAVGIALQEKLEADIYIFGTFRGYAEVADRLRELEIFQTVHAVDPRVYYRIPTRGNAVVQMARCRETVSAFLPQDVVYGALYASSRAHVKNLLLHELLRRNRDLRLVVYDDGLGMYARDSHVLNTTGIRRAAERLLGWDLYRPSRMRFLVNLPELFEAPEGFADCPVAPMPRLPWTAENRSLLMRVFGVEEDDFIRERVIIFDSLRGWDSDRDRKMRDLDGCFSQAADFFGRDNVILKPHPRSLAVSTADIRLYGKTAVPMEVLYAAMDDLDDRVLITYASSAVYTPRMFFDAEPWVVNLFRITDSVDGGVSEWEETFRKFRRVYREPARVMAPENPERFRECLNTIC